MSNSLIMFAFKCIVSSLLVKFVSCTSSFNLIRYPLFVLNLSEHNWIRPVLRHQGRFLLCIEFQREGTQYSSGFFKSDDSAQMHRCYKLLHPVKKSTSEDLLWGKRGCYLRIRERESRWEIRLICSVKPKSYQVYLAKNMGLSLAGDR